MLLANKSTIVRQVAATAGPEEEKIKKFATSIIEFSKVKSDHHQFFLYCPALKSDMRVGRRRKKMITNSRNYLTVHKFSFQNHYIFFVCLCV